MKTDLKNNENEAGGPGDEIKTAVDFLVGQETEVVNLQELIDKEFMMSGTIAFRMELEVGGRSCGVAIQGMVLDNELYLAMSVDRVTRDVVPRQLYRARDLAKTGPFIKKQTRSFVEMPVKVHKRTIRDEASADPKFHSISIRDNFKDDIIDGLLQLVGIEAWHDGKSMTGINVNDENIKNFIPKAEKRLLDAQSASKAKRTTKTL